MNNIHGTKYDNEQVARRYRSHGKKMSITRCDAVLRALADYVDRFKFSPSIRELSDSCNLTSTSVTNYYLNQLQKQGLIEKQPKISRGLSLTINGYERLGRVKPKTISVICPHCGEPYDVPASSVDQGKPDRTPKQMPLAG